ncbi:3'-nucleotidase/nuclease [Legionella birminghamensis]|uniref:3'-nucleotidase/nuclease n=1 Tax=Legionella birminghamensis TaxID=28083 RepID=A0A378IAK8_9GAMM|nr:S1/P1 nuclease [Legionella birminghamensis]KTC75573.1 3'-nucleotidase/nuclease [Legionella birminghamensis]STX31896.1 3'-nucleotidase/nuclease [Legionella birminghamensis]
MLNQVRTLVCLCLLLFMGEACSWNAAGHRLIAQIAYDQLTDEARKAVNHYNHQLDRVYKPMSFVDAAPWMDTLRFRENLWLEHYHYIDNPFTRDGTPLSPPDKVNAVTALNKAIAVLKNSQSYPYDKGFSLRILLHVTGDIHQPMHAVSEFSRRFPEGDAGGNFLVLGQNTIAKNLHSYWDNGGGLLKIRYSKAAQLKRKAKYVEKKWPCDSASQILNPEVWAEESYDMAVNLAYQIHYGEKPTEAYQKQVRAAAEKRIALAGCRLAVVLNDIFGHG